MLDLSGTCAALRRCCCCACDLILRSFCAVARTTLECAPSPHQLIKQSTEQSGRPRGLSSRRPLHHDNCIKAVKHGCANRDLSASDTAAATTSSTAWECDPKPATLARRGIVERCSSRCLTLFLQVQPPARRDEQPIRAPCLRCKAATNVVLRRILCLSQSDSPVGLPTTKSCNVACWCAGDFANCLSAAGTGLAAAATSAFNSGAPGGFRQGLGRVDFGLTLSCPDSTPDYVVGHR